MEDSKVDRINVLYKKQKEQGLTEAEKQEQAVLRKEYVALFRKNFISTMDTVKIQELDGTIRPVKPKQALM